MNKIIKTIEFELKNRIDVTYMIHKLIEKVPIKQLFMRMCLAMNPGYVNECPDFEKTYEAYKILLYVGGNWDKVLKDADAHYSKMEKEAYSKLLTKEKG